MQMHNKPISNSEHNLKASFFLILSSTNLPHGQQSKQSRKWDSSWWAFCPQHKIQ